MMYIEEGSELIKIPHPTNFDSTSSSESQFHVEGCHQNEPTMLQEQNKIRKEPEYGSNCQTTDDNDENAFNTVAENNTTESETTSKVELNSYVQKILQELHLCYEKLRANKESSSETIRSLELEVESYKERNRNMIITNVVCDKDSLTTSNSIETLEEQFQCTVDFYENKIIMLEEELSKRNEEYNVLVNRNMETEEQLAQTNRVLRLEREDANVKKREFKGMELLILEYQNYISENGDEVSERNECIEYLSKEKHKCELQIQELQKTNSELLSQITHIQQQLKNNETELEVNILTHQQNTEQTENGSEKFPKELTQVNSEELNLKIENLSRKLKETENLLELSKAKTINSMEQRMKEKMETKKSIYKIEKIFKEKQKKKSLLIKQELAKLKHENERLKSYFQNELFTLFQDTRSSLMKAKIY